MGLKINAKPTEAKAEVAAAVAGETPKPKTGLKLNKKPPAGASAEVKQAEATIVKEGKNNLTGEQTHVSQSKELVGEQVAAFEPWCDITVDASFTKNLGDYQSTRIGVSLKMPCPPHEMEEAFTITKNWVNEKMELLLGEMAAE